MAKDEPLKDVPNFSAFALWTRLVGDSRPDYVKAFMALSNVRNLLLATDIK